MNRGLAWQAQRGAAQQARPRPLAHAAQAPLAAPRVHAHPAPLGWLHLRCKRPLPSWCGGALDGPRRAGAGAFKPLTGAQRVGRTASSQPLGSQVELLRRWGAHCDACSSPLQDTRPLGRVQRRTVPRSKRPTPPLVALLGREALADRRPHGDLATLWPARVQHRFKHVLSAATIADITSQARRSATHAPPGHRLLPCGPTLAACWLAHCVLGS